MEKQILLSLLLFCTLYNSVNAQEATLSSGDVTLNVNKLGDNSYNVTFKAYDKEINSGTTKNPAVVIDARKIFYANYTSFEKSGEQLKMQAILNATPSTTVFEVNDLYTSKGNGEYELQRNIKVLETGDSPYPSFFSSFGLQFSPSGNLLDNEYFIPGVWYKGNFEPDGNLPNGIPTAKDNNFFYREDRTPLPVVMMREKESGVTFTIIHKDSKCETTLNDCKGVEADAGYQFGGIGVAKRTQTDTYTALATYPGSDLRAGGMGERKHPITEGFDKHNYKVYFKINKTDNYASALRTSWELAYDLYNPKIRNIDLNSAYSGLIETVNHYYMAYPDAQGPGFPWGVNLRDFHLNKNTYELGFVGCQPGAGYALFRDGVENKNEDYQKKGGKVVEFWATNCLSGLGLPKTRYAAMGGTWDNAKTSIRQAATGMGFILNAWCYAKLNGIDKPTWLAASKKFGDFLVSYQEADGSYYLEYDPFKIENGKHPVGIKNKYLTICAVRYLVELYIATGDERYKTAAVKAAEYSYKHIHEKYMYVACVIDNPQTIDSESGQQALNGFLSIYDLTKDKKWLDAAEQAATYEETWSYMFEVPVETDQTENTDWPRDRSIVGQHIIAIGHSATDLGFAWSSFVYYRLYLLTGKKHYLSVARVAAHNTKQSMNLGQELYPGQPEGLQQEAFQVRVTNRPRRTGSIMEALTWNFTAHLDPMIRFMDAFGTCDLEKIEAMPKEKRDELDWRYSFYQSSDYGQDINVAVTDLTSNKNINVYVAYKSLYIEAMNNEDRPLSFQLTDITGKQLLSCCLESGKSSNKYSLSNLNKGIYGVKLQLTSGKYASYKIFVN